MGTQLVHISFQTFSVVKVEEQPLELSCIGVDIAILRFYLSESKPVLCVIKIRV